jgi:hypothetical protein
MKMLPYRQDGNPVFRQATPGNLWISCAHNGGKQVENAGRMRITSNILWTACGQEKRPGKDAMQVLRGPAGRQ